MYPIIEFKFITMLPIESNASEKSNSMKSWFLVYNTDSEWSDIYIYFKK